MFRREVVSRRFQLLFAASENKTFTSEDSRDISCGGAAFGGVVCGGAVFNSVVFGDAVCGGAVSSSGQIADADA